jgi:hypothetical protein
VRTLILIWGFFLCTTLALSAWIVWDGVATHTTAVTLVVDAAMVALMTWAMRQWVHR